MLVIQAAEGEDSGHPSEPQPLPSIAQPTNEEPIPTVVSSSHQKTQTSRQALKEVTELPQTSEPISNVPDEVVYEEWDDRVVVVSGAKKPWGVLLLRLDDLVAEDPSKQRRSMIEEMDLDAGISLVPPHVEVQGSTSSPQRHADTTADDLTFVEKLMKIKKRGKAKMDETESPRKIKQREQVQISRDAEIAQKLQEEVASDEDFVQQLQAGEKCSEEDLPMKLVELVNQRKKFFAQQRAEAKRNKPMNPAQQKEYMSNYIKNPEGGEESAKKEKELSEEEL
ncbi:hypothetical protein Tco_0781532 [Tanacetum coccineum]